MSLDTVVPGQPGSPGGPGQEYQVFQQFYTEGPTMVMAQLWPLKLGNV